MMCQLNLFTNFKFKRTVCRSGLHVYCIKICMHACGHIFHTRMASSYFHFCKNVAHSDYLCAPP